MNNSHLIKYSKNKKIRKQNKYTAKEITRNINLHSLVRAPATGFATLLSLNLALISCYKFSALLLSYPRSLTPSFSLSGFIFSCKTPTILLSCLVPALVPKFLDGLLPLLMLGLNLLHLVSLALRIMKQAFLDRLLLCRWTSFVKTLHPFFVSWFVIQPN